MTMPKTISEKAFSSAVIDYAMLRGWHIAHFRPAMNQRGAWSTPMEGHIGYPDLTLARDGVLIVRELKTQHGLLTPGQRSWLTQLGSYGDVWRPSDWPSIQGVLR